MHALCWNWCDERLVRQVCTLRGENVMFVSYAFAADGKLVFGGSFNHFVQISSTETGAEVCGYLGSKGTYECTYEA